MSHERIPYKEGSWWLESGYIRDKNGEPYGFVVSLPCSCGKVFTQQDTNGFYDINMMQKAYREWEWHSRPTFDNRGYDEIAGSLM